jgi:hypothetical protein
MRRRLREAVHKMVNIATYARRASPAYRVSAITLFARAVPLCLRHQFTGEEAFRLGLLDPDRRMDDLSCYCSRKRFTELQRSLSPASLVPLVRNKAIFYRFCLAQSIPIPALYAVGVGQTWGWTYCDRPVTTIEQWAAFLEHDLPTEFVVKPMEAAFGQGVLLFRRQNDRFTGSGGEELAASSVCECFRADCYRDGFLIQERLYNHPRLLELTDVEYLQTVRLTTLVGMDQQAHVIHSHAKLIAGSNVTDNFHGGSTGNLLVSVDLHDGRLFDPVTASLDVPGYLPLEKHPNSGREIEGFPLPFWDQTCALVREAAIRFLPIRSIGWDVALTPGGPVIVEGNIWWDPPNQQKNLHIILQTIRDLCPSVT